MSEQVPFDTMVTVAVVVFPLRLPVPTVQTPVELLLNATSNDEVSVAVMENGATP